MNGKVLKVIEYNLTFGNTARMVNVFSCFKYKPNNNLYLLYADVDTKYNIIYYGSSHIKNTTILSMECRDKQDEEIIKEYIFKTTNHKSLDDFNIISLEEVEGVEIISSNKLEVKPEVLQALTEATIPKKEEPVTPAPTKKNTKKKGLPYFMWLILLVLIIGVGYFYLSSQQPPEGIAKTITCQKTYDHDTLNASLEEESTYNFNHQDTLQSIYTTTNYHFYTEEDYQNFITKGTYYRYMPDAAPDGGWDKDDTTNTFKIMIKETVKTGYDKPTDYEGVLASNKKEGYTCTENIEND